MRSQNRFFEKTVPKGDQQNSFFKLREAKVNVEELHQQTARSTDFPREEGPRMSAVATWLNNRKGAERSWRGFRHHVLLSKGGMRMKFLKDLKTTCLS